jgi:hypothetical protein
MSPCHSKVTDQGVCRGIFSGFLGVKVLRVHKSSYFEGEVRLAAQTDPDHHNLGPWSFLEFLLNVGSPSVFLSCHLDVPDKV